MKSALKLLSAFICLSPAFICVPAAAKEPPPNKELAAFFDREFKHDLAEHPESATVLGIPGFDDRITDPSPKAIARRKAHVKEVIRELKRFDPAKLATQDRISRDIALEEAELQDAKNALYGNLPFGAEFGDSWLAVSSQFGPHDGMAYVMRATRFATARDYDNYLKRLSLAPAYMKEIIERMRVGMKTRWVPPREAMGRVPGMLDDFADDDATKSPLWRPFTEFPADMPVADRERIAAEGRRVLAGKVNPAFAALKRFLVDEYIPACSDKLGASSLPAGPAYYKLMVREMTTLPLDPAKVHQTGLDEVARIHGEMEKVIASTGFKGSFEDFNKFLRTDPRFYFKTAEERLRAYRDIAKRADAELPKLFATLPRQPYGVRAMEAYEGDNSDHYSPGALDGSRAGFFEANVNNLDKRPSYEMESTLLHEAVPGHHLQGARALELEGLPVFRRSTWYVGYGEGWALYAESLGYEMGFYTDPYQHYGALAGEMMRACRLVVDTGLHSMDWSREQAIKYLVDNAGIHPDYAAAEVDRYIVWPAQALGYKVGELKIKALRAKAKAALGDKFDLRRFHNVLLDDGAVPLTILESRVDEWIASEKKKSAKS